MTIGATPTWPCWTDGVTSVLAMLAREGKVRITLVEPVSRRKAAAHDVPDGRALRKRGW